MLIAKAEVGARPIRMRGYYRAIKRKISWAIEIDSIKDPLRKGLALFYRNVDFKCSVYSENPFFNLIKNQAPEFKYTPVFLDYCYRKRKRARFRNKTNAE